MSEVIRRETDRIGRNEAAEALLTLQIYRDFRLIRQENGSPVNVPCNSKSRSRDTSSSIESDCSESTLLPSSNESMNECSNESINENLNESINENSNESVNENSNESIDENSNESSNAAGSSKMKIKVQPEDAVLWKPANTRQQDLIKIGDSGRTWMKKKDYAKIKFNNYKRATRTILMGVFGSRTLATHTRSGKPCPIYKKTTDRKVKPQLPEVPLNDIRIEIRKHFDGLADELINESITTKCADEGRKYRKEETEPED